MTSKHTPGPWRLSASSPNIIKQDYTYLGLDEESGVLIGSACGNDKSGFYPDEDEGRANARLISAAPELLEALEGIANHYDMDGYGEKAWKDLALEMADLARAAIAKATGEA